MSAKSTKSTAAGQFSPVKRFFGDSTYVRVEKAHAPAKGMSSSPQSKVAASALTQFAKLRAK